MRDAKTGYLLVLGAAVLWGTTGTAQALGSPAAQPMVVGTLRTIIAGAVFLALSPLTGGLRPPYRRELPWVIGGSVLVLAYQLFFFVAVRAVGVAVGTVIQIGTAPFAAGVLGVLFLREPMTRRWIVATILGIVGIAMVSLGPDSAGLAALAGLPSGHLVGVLLAAGAGVSYAGFSLCLKRVGESMSASAAATWIFVMSGILSVPFVMAHDLAWICTLRGSVSMLHLGVIATAVAYLLFTRGIRSVHFGTAITATLVEGVTATVLGVSVLGEALSFTRVLGIAVVLLAIWLNGRPKRFTIK